MRGGGCRLPLTGVEAVAHFGVEVVAGSIAQMEGHRGIALSQYLLAEVYTEGRLAVAQRQRVAARAGLASLICHIGCHHEVIEQRMPTLRHRQGHGHGERTVVGSSGLARCHLLVAAGVAQEPQIPVAAVRPPPEGHAAHHLIADLGALYRYAGIAAGHGLGLYGVASLVVLFHLVEADLERWPLVLLHPEAAALAVGTDGEQAGESRCREGEADGTRAILVRLSPLRLHLFIISVAQREGDGAVLERGMLEAVTHLVDEGRHADGLSGAIDGPVGEETGLLHLLVPLVIVVARREVHLRRGIVGGSIGKHLPAPALRLFQEALPLCIGHEVMGLVVLPRDIFLDAQTGLRNGLTGGSTHHHVARPPVGLLLGHGEHVGHVVHPADGACRRLRGELQHIDAHGQCCQRQRVAEHLIVGMLACEGMTDARIPQLCKQRLQPLIVVGVHRVEVEVSPTLDSKHLHLQRAQVAHLIDHHRLTALWQSDAMVYSQTEHRGCQFRHRIAQRIQLRIAPPLADGPSGIAHALGDSGLGHTAHHVVALHGHLASLRQILIAADERVEGELRIEN